jgi:type II secretion system protein D
MDYRVGFAIAGGSARAGRLGAVCLLVAAVIGLAGCQYGAKTEPQPGLPARAAEAPAAADLWDEKPLVVDTVVPEREQGLEARTPLPERRAVTPTEVPVSQYPENLIKGVEDPEAKVQVTLNLDAMQITQLVEAFAQILQFSYLVDPGIANKGAVTINVDSEMTAREAWETFEHILWLSGAYASRNPGFIHILPFDKMPKERRLLFKGEILANVEVVLIPVRYRKSGDMANLIEPFKTEGATIKDLTDSNTLLIVEAPANMPKMRELIAELDNRGEAAWPHLCLPCRNVDVEELQADLETILPTLGFPVTNKSPSNGAVKLAALPRIQCIIVSAAMQDVLDEVERWVKALDTADLMERENIYWYNVKHSTAEQLKEALEVFFNTQATTGTRPSRTKSTSSKARATSSSRRGGRPEEPRTQEVPVQQPQQKSQTTKPKEAGEEVGGTIFDTPVVVLVDEVRERLTIRTTPRAYALVEALLQRQDVSPRQVSIQATIADVTLAENTEYGFSYAAKEFVSRNGDKVSVVSSGIGGIPADLSAQNFAFLFKDRSGDPLAFIKAVAGEGNTRVLSEPQIIVLSGEEAQINVGERVPVPTEAYTTYGGSSDNLRTNYEYEDTGVIMEVKPHVTAGNDVRLEIRQEVSDAAASEDPAIPPRITNKVIESVLTIADGATVVMGGLIRSKHTDASSGWLFLKDIPYLGVLFRTNKTTDDRTELLVMLTVNVVETESQVEHLLRRYRAALAHIEEAEGRGVP